MMMVMRAAGERELQKLMLVDIDELFGQASAFISLVHGYISISQPVAGLISQKPPNVLGERLRKAQAGKGKH